MFTVYILRSLKNGRLYTGYTNNLTRRLKEHNTGQATYTRLTKPHVLIYQEVYSSQREAMNRERFSKIGKGRKMLKSIIR